MCGLVRQTRILCPKCTRQSVTQSELPGIVKALRCVRFWIIQVVLWLIISSVALSLLRPSSARWLALRQQGLGHYFIMCPKNYSMCSLNEFFVCSLVSWSTNSTTTTHPHFITRPSVFSSSCLNLSLLLVAVPPLVGPTT